MKLVLKTGEEFQVNSLARLSDNQIQISFASISDYGILRTRLVVGALKEVKYYPVDNVSYEVYSGFTKIIDPVSITTAGDGTLNVAIVLQKEDELSQRTRQNEEDIQALYAGLNFLFLQ